MEDSISKISVCIHGGIRRKCETCDLAERLEAAEARVRELEQEVARFACTCYPWEKVHAVGCPRGRVKG